MLSPWTAPSAFELRAKLSARTPPLQMKGGLPALRRVRLFIASKKLQSHSVASPYELSAPIHLIVRQLGVLYSRMAAAGAGAAAFSCQKIIDKITARFDIAGIESLLEIDHGQEKTFYISLFKKDTTSPEIASISGNSFKPNRLYIVELQRTHFRNNNSTKGAGLLLLDLVACHATEKNMQLDFEATPSMGTKSNHNTGLYNFYNRAGMKASGPEKGVGDSRSKSYSTSPNNLRTALASRYKGGKRHTRRRRHTAK